MAKIEKLPILKIKRPSYWNATFGFDFDLFIVTIISMWFCTGLSKFMQIKPPTTEF